MLATFGLRNVEPEPLGSEWSSGWRCGDVVLTPGADHARATWSAGVRETLVIDRVRLARPVRSTDGRWVVSGWTADTFLTGQPEPRHLEVVEVAQRLHTALESAKRPRFLTGAVDPADFLAVADAAAWAERPAGAGLEVLLASDLWQELAEARTPVESPAQLVHGDLFGTVLFAGAAEPGITELTPFWRPAAWGSAVAVVDALAWGNADEELLTSGEQLPEWPQMLLRALLFRLAVHALHPHSTPEALDGLLHTSVLVREQL